MARLRVWSKPLGAGPRRYWLWSVTGHQGVEVMRDDGYGTWWRAYVIGHNALVGAVLVERHGHTLRPWSELVDEADTDWG